MTDPHDTITIPRKLAVQLLGQLEQMAKQIEGGGCNMPVCYYQLWASLLLLSLKNDITNIELD